MSERPIYGQFKNLLTARHGNMFVMLKIGHFNLARLVGTAAMFAAVTATALGLLPQHTLTRDQWGAIGLLLGSAGIALLLDVHRRIVDTKVTRVAYHLSRQDSYDAASRLLKEITTSNASKKNIVVVTLLDIDQSGNEARPATLTKLFTRALSLGSSVEEMFILSESMTDGQRRGVAHRIQMFSQYPTATIRLGTTSGNDLAYAPMSIGDTLLLGMYGTGEAKHIVSAIELPDAGRTNIDRAMDHFRATTSTTALISQSIDLAAIRSNPYGTEIAAFLESKGHQLPA